MSYVIYRKSDTKRIGNKSHSLERIAKAAVTRLVNKGKYTREEIAIAETTHYNENIAAMVERINAMTGKKFMESINTPYYCSPSSETYWSM